MPVESANGHVVRQIYRYSDGTKDVAADPAVLWRRLGAACRARETTWEALCDRWRELTLGTVADDGEAGTAATADADSRGEAWLEFQGEFTAIVRDAFGLGELAADGTGVTEGEALAVLAGFLEWREKKDASTASSPSTSSPSAGDPQAGSSPSSAN